MEGRKGEGKGFRVKEGGEGAELSSKDKRLSLGTFKY